MFFKKYILPKSSIPNSQNIALLYSLISFTTRTGTLPRLFTLLLPHQTPVDLAASQFGKQVLHPFRRIKTGNQPVLGLEKILNFLSDR